MNTEKFHGVLDGPPMVCLARHVIMPQPGWMSLTKGDEDWDNRVMCS
jgi:hypothetical protein